MQPDRAVSLASDALTLADRAADLVSRIVVGSDPARRAARLKARASRLRRRALALMPSKATDRQVTRALRMLDRATALDERAAALTASRT